ncbi:hypothetical protein ACLB1G_18255 [Oxalobacteraceae bacterium A2-2]
MLLREADLARIGSRLPSICSYVEVKCSGADKAAQARVYAGLKHSSVPMVGRPVSTWADFDASAALGLDAFVGKLHLTPRPGNHARGLNPAQALVLQLMHMVQQNADIAQVEAALGQGEAEQVFVAGMFSLLDRLLGIPMAEVLDSVQLSEDVVAALLTRGGKYGP